MEVKNLQRAYTPPSCGCDSYLEHWSRATGEFVPTICRAKGCKRTVDVGAHIINCSDTSKNSWKIVPLCNLHNTPENTECFPLNKGVKTPSVSQLTSCKKKK